MCFLRDEFGVVLLFVFPLLEPWIKDGPLFRMRDQVKKFLTHFLFFYPLIRKGFSRKIKKQKTKNKKGGQNLFFEDLCSGSYKKQPELRDAIRGKDWPFFVASYDERVGRLSRCPERKSHQRLILDSDGW